MLPASACTRTKKVPGGASTVKTGASDHVVRRTSVSPDRIPASMT